ncbi:unnamed protein product [Zymoseptoria tritici ST99CH_3D7]|uniref:Uncharacterized protein n=1 Tax=Zymoseptoria tritici (strain ST99CH_3D7) TaxID=1276538 RepID=A0A1X7SAH1_ZYMT9|nr:unnamed protein product [Zymoseptoria tritici ST99CH_3D7]
MLSGENTFQHTPIAKGTEQSCGEAASSSDAHVEEGEGEATSRKPERSESSPFIVLTDATANPHHTAADTQKSLKRDMSDSPTTNVSPSDV